MSQLPTNPSPNDLAHENRDLRRQIVVLKERLELAESTVEAIHGGEVDAVVVDRVDDTRVFAFTAAERVHLELAQEVAGVGTWNWDVEANRVVISEGLRSDFQLPNSRPTVDDLFKLVHPDDRLHVLSNMRHHLKSPPDDYYDEFRVVLPDGLVKWVVSKGRVIRGDNDEPLYVVGINFDITERKLAEEELRRRGEALQEADRRKDQFLATLAHELRNPLSPLSIAAELLALRPSDDPSRQELVDVIARQCVQLKRLIDDLMDVSRVSTGKLNLRVGPVLLRDAVSAALDISRPVIEAAAHHLEVVQPNEHIVVQGDAVRLAQIIANLLVNAAKYTPPGGRIELEVRTEGEKALIRVSDTGVGIPSELFESIFELFTQVDSSLTRAQGGLGIGLTLVKKLVDLHGGTVEPSSDGPGRGATFVVRLPLSAETGDLLVQQEGSGDDGTPLPKNRVLVVDDNPEAARVLRKLLEELGQEVRIAHSADTAIDVLNEFCPEAVISDVAMPGISGYELAERIRGLRLACRPMLVALTGYGQSMDRHDALSAGFDDHLVKPISLADARLLLASLADRTSQQ